MTLLSKLMNTELKNLTCREIFHPNCNCWKSFWLNSINYFPSNVKLFLPIILISLLFRIKKINYNLIKESLYQFLDYTISGYTMGLGLTVSICLLRKIFRRFHFYTILFVPGILAGLPVYFYSTKTSRLFAISIFETCLEIMFRRKSDPISRIIGNSKYIQTLIFMTSSSIILHLAQKHKIQILWFMTSPTINSITSNENFHCQHKNHCRTYLLNGIKTYMTIGITLDTIKFISSSILPNLSQNGIKNSFMGNFKSFQFDSTKFLTSYAVIYRATNCILNKYYTNNSKISNHSIAAFLGGSVYIFNCNLTYLAYGICIAIEMIWKSFKLNKSESRIVNRFKDISWDRILYPFGIGMTAHFYFHEQHLVSKLGKNITNRTTNFKAERVYQRILNMISSVKTE